MNGADRASLPAGVLNLQGRAYPTWAYTLDAAHTLNTAPLVRFLGIRTQIVQLPTPDNGQVAVVQATVTWRNAEGDTVEFGGIGDANPANCGSVGKTALLRMAEVRAKGRALRDSVNVGDVLDEELSLSPEGMPPVRETARATHETSGHHQENPTAAKRARLDALLAQYPDALKATGGRGAAAIRDQNLDGAIAKLEARARADAAVDPKAPRLLEAALAEARALLAAIGAAPESRPHAGDYDRLRTLLLVIQHADKQPADADPDTIQASAIVPYTRARLSGYVLDTDSDEAKREEAAAR